MFIINSHRFGSFDEDAIVYIAALETAGYSATSAVKKAINTFFLGLKDASLWTDTECLYLFIGGFAAPCLINARNPGTNNLTAHGTIYYSDMGVKGDGSTGYFSIPTAIQSLTTSTGACFSIYCRTNISGSGTAESGTTEFGLQDDGYPIVLCVNSANAHGCFGKYYNNRIDASVSDAYGLLLLSRVSSGLHLYKKGVSLGSNSNSMSYGGNSTPYILARHNGNQSGSYSPQQIAFCHVGSAGFDATQQSNFYSLVQAFETALGRNV